MERLKTLESLPQNVSVSHVGAYWQSVKGNKDEQACHTCPTLLLINGRLPTLVSSNISWRQHVINVFADCMLMPKSINEIDGVLDSVIGRAGFAATVESLLVTPDKSWSDSARDYREVMREFLAPLQQLKQTDDPRIEALQGFYEGLFLTSARHEVDCFRANLERSL